MCCSYVKINDQITILFMSRQLTYVKLWSDLITRPKIRELIFTKFRILAKKIFVKWAQPSKRTMIYIAALELGMIDPGRVSQIITDNSRIAATTREISSAILSNIARPMKTLDGEALH